MSIILGYLGRMPVSQSDIVDALDKGGFFPAFQPQVELQTGRLVGFEILARLRHQDLGEIMPGEFIATLEKTGLIERLTPILLEQALSIPALKDPSISLSINFCPLQLLDLKSPKLLASIADRSGFSLNRLTVEITESALFSDLERAVSVAQELKALGCKLSIDDFGTGYSSLRHLHALPFDELKVDQSFVERMLDERESRKIVASVIGLGNNLGLRTIAEGVHVHSQVNMLVWLGCDIGQGEYYSSPVPAKNLQQLITQNKLDAARLASGNAGREASLLAGLEAHPSERFAQLQAIYDGVPAGLCFLDRELRFVNLNRRLADMNELPLAAVMGRKMENSVPQTFPLVESFLRRALKGESVLGVEYTSSPHGEDNRGSSVLASFQPVLDEKRDVIGVSAAFMDVTERELLDESLHACEEHFRQIASLDSALSWVANTNGDLIDVDQRWEEVTGQRKEDGLGDGWLKVLHPEDVLPAKNAIQMSVELGQMMDIELRFRGAGGGWIRLRVRGLPRFGPTGKTICVYGVLEELGHGSQETADLTEPFARLRRASNALAFGVVIADARRGTIYLVNETARDICGKTLASGMTLSEQALVRLSHLDGTSLDPNDYPLTRSVLRSEAVDEEEFLFNRKTPSPERLMISSWPIYDHGQLIGAISTLRATTVLR